MKRLLTVASATILASALSTDVQARMPVPYPGVTFDNNVVVWAGPMSGFQYKVFKLMTEGKTINKIIFHSNGGRASVGMKMATLIEQNNIAVEVNQNCDSACSMAALASPNLSGRGVLGFHMAYLPDNVNNSKAIEENNTYNRYIAKQLSSSPYLTKDIISDIVYKSNPNKVIEVSILELNQNKGK